MGGRRAVPRPLRRRLVSGYGGGLSTWLEAVFPGLEEEALALPRRAGTCGRCLRFVRSLPRHSLACAEIGGSG